MNPLEWSPETWYLILGYLGGLFTWAVVELLTSPEGYQDKEGFHYGKPNEKKELKDIKTDLKIAEETNDSQKYSIEKLLKENAELERINRNLNLRLNVAEAIQKNHKIKV